LEKLSTYAEAPSWYHPGRSGELRLGPKQTLARFGEIHPRIAAAFDIKGPVVAIEVLLPAVPFAKAKTRRIAPLQASVFQAVERDFAFLVASEVSAETLVRSVRGAEKSLIAAATVFDVYEGDKVEKGKKSIAVTITLQAADRTLTEAEIDSVSQKIVAQVTKQTGAVLRG
jgi:phenylalanyl-tRNA synthetase beta chain